MLITSRSHSPHPRPTHAAPTVRELQARSRWASVANLAVVAAITLFVAWQLSSSSTAGSPALLAGAVVAPVILVWVWRQPVRGVYVLVAAAVMQEATFGRTFPDDIAHDIPFFEDLSTWTHIRGLPYSIAELFIAFVLVSWVIKGVAARRLRFDRGSLMLPLGLYILMCLVGELHGLATGGNYTLSLWELRGQGYLFVLYVLACNLVRTRGQVNMIIWTVVVGSGLKAVQATYRYLVTLHGSLSLRELMPHEQSYFFNAFIVLALIFYLYGAPRRLKRVALYFLPFVVVADLANERRAAILALAVGLLCLAVTVAVTHPARRRVIAFALVTVAVLWIPYYNQYQHDSSVIAQPARAIASNFSPNAADASSDQYRKDEDKDIIATMRTSPIIGYGFGKPMLTPYPLPNVGYPFWNLLPHDSILWIWMRMGTVGYLLFWLLIGASIVQALRLTRRLRDPYLQGLAAFIAVMIVQEVIVGYLDLQWTTGRNTIVVGVLLALVGRLAAVARVEGSCSAPPLVQAGKRGRVGGRSEVNPPRRPVTGAPLQEAHAFAPSPRG